MNITKITDQLSGKIFIIFGNDLSPIANRPELSDYVKTYIEKTWVSEKSFGQYLVQWVDHRTQDHQDLELLAPEQEEEQFSFSTTLPEEEAKPLTEAQELIRDLGGRINDVTVKLDDGRLLGGLTVYECPKCGEACTINGAFYSGPLTKSPIYQKKAKDWADLLGLGEQNEMICDYDDDGNETECCERCA